MDTFSHVGLFRGKNFGCAGPIGGRCHQSDLDVIFQLFANRFFSPFFKFHID